MMYNVVRKEGLMNNKLSPTEYQFMEIIWEHPDGVSSFDIYNQFSQSLSAKSTILSRIVKKGHARCEHKGKQVYYYANLTKRDYEKLIIQEDIKQKMGFNSFQKLFAAFCGKKGLTENQANQLRKLIEEMEDDE
ncbi:MAG TPA: hypothetical protein DC053_08085 [Lachnoclostridium sp.]|nr:hypothetical protein [Lachnoclostridium sp.]